MVPRGRRKHNSVNMPGPLTMGHLDVKKKGIAVPMDLQITPSHFNFAQIKHVTVHDVCSNSLGHPMCCMRCESNAHGRVQWVRAWGPQPYGKKKWKPKTQGPALPPSTYTSQKHNHVLHESP